MTNTPEKKFPKNKVKLELKRLASSFKLLQEKFFILNLKLHDPNTSDREFSSLNEEIKEVHRELTSIDTLAKEYTQLLGKISFEHMRVPDQLSHLLKNPEFSSVQRIFGVDPSFSMELLPVGEFTKIIYTQDFADNNAANILEQSTPESFENSPFFVEGGVLAQFRKSTGGFYFPIQVQYRDLHRFIIENKHKNNYLPDFRFILWVLDNQNKNTSIIQHIKNYLSNTGDRLIIPGCILTTKDSTSYFLFTLVYVKDTQKIEVEIINAVDVVSGGDANWYLYMPLEDTRVK